MSADVVFEIIVDPMVSHQSGSDAAGVVGMHVDAFVTWARVYDELVFMDCAYSGVVRIGFSDHPPSFSLQSACPFVPCDVLYCAGELPVWCRHWV